MIAPSAGIPDAGAGGGAGGDGSAGATLGSADGESFTGLADAVMLICWPDS